MKKQKISVPHIPIPENNAEFLTSIFGEDTPVWTTNFRGDPDGKWKDGEFRNLPKLKAKDESKSNTYFCISTFKVSEEGYRARRNGLFDAMYLVVIDDVGTKGQSLDEVKSRLEPTYVIETSRKNYQVGYVLSKPCAEINEATNIIGSINYDQGDKGSKGVNRVMRLPYGINCKPKNKNFKVNIKEWSDQKFSIDDLVKAFNVNMTRLTSPYSIKGSRGNENVRDKDLNVPWKISEITTMLAFINPDSFDYDDWLGILMAVHSEHPTPEGLAVIDEWCKGGTRYKKDEVYNRWNGFEASGKATGRKGIGTLIYLAKIAGWKPKDTRETKSLVDELVAQYIWCIGQEKFIDTNKVGIMLTPHGLRRTMLGKISKADERILLHKNHVQVVNPTFVPAAGKIVNIGGEDYYNIWKPSGINAVEGDILPFLEIMEHVYPDPIIREIMMWFMAHTVIRPEFKIRWVPLIISRNEGIGKTIIFEKMVAELVGQQFSRSIGEDELFGNFNGYAPNTKLMMIEEIWVPGLEGKKLVNKLKPVQSNDMLRVNEKNIRPYDIRNYISMVTFSNHIDAAAISKYSRRNFVYISPAVTMDAIKNGWGNEFKFWLKNGGLEHVLWYFQNEVDLDAFEAGGNAPHTTDRELVSAMSEDGFASLLKDRQGTGGVPFDRCRGFVSLEDIKSLWRISGYGNRTTGYFDNIFHDMGWVYVTGVMKKVDGKPRRWPSGWCVMPGIKLLKPSSQYTLLEAQSNGRIDLEDSIENQPKWVRELISATDIGSVTPEVTE